MPDGSVQWLVYTWRMGSKRDEKWLWKRSPVETPIIDVSSGEYYGEGYQDILTRVPSIRRAQELLGWEPKVSMDEAIRKTVAYYLDSR